MLHIIVALWDDPGIWIASLFISSLFLGLYFWGPENDCTYLG